MDNLFSTHPAVENRIAALRQLAGQMGTSGYSRMHRHFHAASGSLVALVARAPGCESKPPPLEYQATATDRGIRLSFARTP
jgi:predicted Zn-dependent protease